MSFGVSDKEMSATIEKMEGGKKIESLLISTEPSYINHYNSIFEELWKNGIDATERIKDIEAGLDTAEIEIIQNPKEAIERTWSYLETSRSNVSVLFPTANAFSRQIHMGLLQPLKEATEQRGVQIRILIPASEQIMHIINEAKTICPLVDFRIAEENLQTQITLVLIDKIHCMIVELKDDTRDSSYNAAGLSTYSNSKSIILSYTSIFEILWKQNELYEQLKIHDKMQKEFINIAAHELRTPIQPILGLTDNILSHPNNIEQAKLLEVIRRNAKRLQQLTEDILDVTKIESHSLNLNKEWFNLNDVMANIINDALTSNNASLKKERDDTSSIKLEYRDPQNIFVQADRGRITQVICNLLSNGIKFTKEGTISVNLERKKVDNDNCRDYVVISLKDSGQGINPEIFPKLFTKFATKSEKGGTGLGLFISKSIVEAHGGKIWASNNTDGKGATFSFSLPTS
jgi:signal transduction histidine kinase